ncbi:MAG: HU family DNA-binding protein [Deltaproteobacteria bacterium]|nr:HU family DNA-binding protein [Deltaproteobacteria bacterium]
MNKKELAVKLAQTTGLTQVKAMEVLNAIFDARPGHGIIGIELNKGGKVSIPGYGTFFVKTRAARVGTNPSTQAKIKIPARKFPAFRPGKTLKERIAR